MSLFLLLASKLDKDFLKSIYNLVKVAIGI